MTELALECGGEAVEGDCRVMLIGEMRGMWGKGEEAIVANGRLLVDGAEIVLAGGVSFVGRLWYATPGEETTWFDSR